MTNPLKDLKKMMASKSGKTLLGTVTSSSNGKLHVELNSGSTVIVWGTASIGDHVMVKDGSLIAIVEEETVNTVIIP